MWTLCVQRAPALPSCSQPSVDGRRLMVRNLALLVIFSVMRTICSKNGSVSMWMATFSCESHLVDSDHQTNGRASIINDYRQIVGSSVSFYVKSSIVFLFMYFPLGKAFNEMTRYLKETKM